MRNLNAVEFFFSLQKGTIATPRVRLSFFFCQRVGLGKDSYALQVFFFGKAAKNVKSTLSCKLKLSAQARKFKVRHSILIARNSETKSPPPTLVISTTVKVSNPKKAKRGPSGKVKGACLRKREKLRDGVVTQGMRR